MHHEARTIDDGSRDRAEALERLHAAAPDLLAACELAMDGFIKPAKKPSAAVVIAALQDAIAKARPQPKEPQ